MIRISAVNPYDVAICGAGLAGLCLARQLKLETPDLRVALVDKQTRPLQAGTHKVGESSIEAGTHYLTHTLKLQDYLDRVHKYKCGLRFFTKSGQTPIDQRTETGSPDFPAIPAMQLDRGVLENDLRQMCVDIGVELVEGVSVKDVRLAEGNEHHEVDLQDTDQHIATIRARWVIDAMGRRRFFGRKLGLAKQVSHRASACWWRIPGKWDVTDAVAQPGPDSDWHERELGPRWYSTNHFMGYGYWVWVIPVAQHTSIGIVADESIHPLAERSSIADSLKWLEKHEPHIWRWLKDAEVSDFIALRNFAHTSKQFYSSQRWACVGEAALFGDPYYSTGTDLIALQNNVVSRMIRMDAKGQLTESIVKDYNELVAEFFRGVLALYDGQYTVFGNEYVHYQKTMWDYDYITGPMGKLGFAPHVLDEVEALPEITKMLRKWSDLNIRVQKLLRDWAKLAPNKTIDRSDTAETKIGRKGMLVPNMQVFQTFNDQLKMRDAKGLIEACTGNLLEFAQGRAVWMFKKAVKDLRTASTGVPASLLDQIDKAPWLNPDAIGLDAAEWETNGLLQTAETRILDQTQMDYMVPATPDRESLVKSYPRPHELIWQHIQQTPDRTAVVCGDVRLTYGELGTLAASVSHHLADTYGCRHGTVAAVSEPAVETLGVFLGALSAESAFVGVPRGSRSQWMLRDIVPALTVVGAEDRFTASGKIVRFTDLIDGKPRAMPETKKATLGNRLARCYARYKGGDDYPKLHWISHYALMNFYLYTELALRRRMALNSAEAVHPKLVLLSTTLGGHDWLLPLAYGGTLVLPARPGSNSELFEQVERIAEELGGQPVLSGTPEELLRVTKGISRREGVMLLSLDRGLTAAESGTLTKTVPITVNSGVILWGHEDLWPEKVRKSALADTSLMQQQSSARLGMSSLEPAGVT